MIDKELILRELSLFDLATGGIGNWFSDITDSIILDRLCLIDKQPLPMVQFNQLLGFSHEAPVSYDFFRYYWLDVPKHFYNVKDVPEFDESWTKAEEIINLKHLKWGFYRLFIDALFCFGNVHAGFRRLRSMNMKELSLFFKKRRYETELIKKRGPALSLEEISKDDRYLISEMACKSYGDSPQTPGELKKILLNSYQVHKQKSGGRITFKELLSGECLSTEYYDRKQELLFSITEVEDELIESEKDIENKYEGLAERYFRARKSALNNTNYYLSMVNDLDVYVATSMRNRQHFRNMVDTCNSIFTNKRLKDLKLRYFDPTLSAANGHEDKGIIECLMVKCAKVLVYCAGEKESYGKDAEAAMALSFGKPVIFYCDQKQKSRFYKEVHPLSRLIEFNTGVAVGAMVTDSLNEVSELLYRIFENKMVYRLEQHEKKKGYLRLKENLTKSVVRIQTNDKLLTETFWNHYNV